MSILSSKSTPVFLIEISLNITHRKTIITCNMNLLFGDFIIFKSENSPTKSIEDVNRCKFLSSWKKYIEINNKKFKIPKVILNHNQNDISNHDIKEGLEFNKSLLIENFILPNKLKLPLFRNMLETYFT